MAATLTLPVFDRLAPPHANLALPAAIEAGSGPDDVVVDLAGRGGWVARAALSLGRRALSIETSPLTRLLADVVVRPPDLRHLDAAFQGVGSAPLGTSSLRAWMTERFATKVFLPADVLGAYGVCAFASLPDPENILAQCRVLRSRECTVAPLAAYPKCFCPCSSALLMP